MVEAYKCDRCKVFFEVGQGKKHNFDDEEYDLCNMCVGDLKEFLKGKSFPQQEKKEESAKEAPTTKEDTSTEIIDVTEDYDVGTITDTPEIKAELCKYEPTRRTLPKNIVRIRKYIRQGLTVDQARREAHLENQRELVKAQKDKIKQGSIGEEYDGVKASPGKPKIETMREEMEDKYGEEKEEKVMCTICFDAEAGEDNDVCDTCQMGLDSVKSTQRKEGHDITRT